MSSFSAPQQYAQLSITRRWQFRTQTLDSLETGTVNVVQSSRGAWQRRLWKASCDPKSCYVNWVSEVLCMETGRSGGSAAELADRYRPIKLLKLPEGSGRVCSGRQLSRADIGSAEAGQAEGSRLTSTRQPKSTCRRGPCGERTMSTGLDSSACRASTSERSRGSYRSQLHVVCGPCVTRHCTACMHRSHAHVVDI